MSKQKVTLTPIDLAAATQTGKRTFRKQVLPLGSIDYKGRKITFDKPYLESLAKAFKDQAYDQVPFVFADPDNRHNMDPERFRGEVKSLELAEDGLDMVVSVTPKGAKAIKSNPRLGVSARIVEGLAKSDGRTYPRAIQHVLATMDPRVTGLRPWKSVTDLSSTDKQKITDLTSQTFEEKNMAKAKDTGGSSVVRLGGKEIDLSQVSDEEFEDLVASVDLSGGDDDAPEGTNRKGKATSEKDKKKAKNKKAKAKKGSGATDLSTPLAKDTVATVEQMRVDLAADRWKAERRDFVKAGVPPHMLDLAAPVLSSPDTAVIDLSGSDEAVDATEVIRKMVEGMRGIVDLSDEGGHQVDLSESEKDADGKTPSDRLLEQWDADFGAIA